MHKNRTCSLFFFCLIEEQRTTNRAFLSSSDVERNLKVAEFHFKERYIVKKKYAIILICWKGTSALHIQILKIQNAVEN
jgi:hypothetical protein